MSIRVGTVETDIEASTTTDSDGDYSFSVAGGTISGTVYGDSTFATSDIKGAVVRLLKSRVAAEYAVMVEEIGFWETRIAPYPLQAAPFTQDFDMGYILRCRLRENGVYKNAEGVTFLFDLTVDESAVDHFLAWANAEGCKIDDRGDGVYVWTSDRNFALETVAVDGEDGWVTRVEPFLEQNWQGVIFPRGHGAQTQRATDYRDDSAQTQAVALPWYVTACTAWYKGASVDVPLDGTTAILDYDPPSLAVTGCPANAEVWLRGRTDHHVPNGEAAPDILTGTCDGAGDCTFAQLWPGRYYVSGHITNGVNKVSGEYAVDLEWGETGALDMTGRFVDIDQGDGSHMGLWAPVERTAGATVYAQAEDPEHDPSEYYVVAVGTVDANGLGIVEAAAVWNDEEGEYWTTGDCFVDIPTFGYGRSGPEILVEPRNHVGAYGVVYAQKAFKEFGNGDNEWFRDIPNPDPTGLHVKPASGHTVPSDFADVELVADDLAPSRLRTTVGDAATPLPGFEYQGTVVGQPEPDPDAVAAITWELQDERGTVLDSSPLPMIEPYGWGSEDDYECQQHCANQLWDVVVGSRIKGGAALWSTNRLDDTAPRESAPELLLELEFGEISEGPMLVLPLPVGDVTPGKRYGCGFSHISCPYCGNATDWDPDLGTDRWRCAHCYSRASSHISGRGHFATAPLAGAAATAHENSPTAWEIELIVVDARTLSTRRCTRRDHFRPECYWEDNGHQEQYLQLLPWQAHHIGIDTGITDGMGSWTPSGFASGYSCSSWATHEAQADRVIGPVQPKMVPTEAFGQAVQIRIEAKRDDDSLIYYYGTIPASAELNEPIRFSQVMRSPPSGDIVAMATVYAGDGDASPYTESDVIVEITNAWALNPTTEEYELTASWLSGGKVRFDNDNPSIRLASVRTRRAEWTHYLAHLLVAAGVRQPHLFHDSFGRKFLFFTAEGDVRYRYAAKWGDLRSDDAAAEYGEVTDDGQSAYPWADKTEDGRVVLVREYGGSSIYVRESSDNCQSWSADVSIASGEKPRGCLFDGRLYLTRISGGQGQVARTPRADFRELDTWPDGSTWKDVGASEDAVPVDKDVGGRQVVFAVSDGGTIDIYVSTADGEGAVLQT